MTNWILTALSKLFFSSPSSARLQHCGFGSEGGRGGEDGFRSKCYYQLGWNRILMRKRRAKKKEIPKNVKKNVIVVRFNTVDVKNYHDASCNKKGNSTILTLPATKVKGFFFPVFLVVIVVCI